MKAIAKKYILDFKQPSGTSRGILNKKETWFLILENDGKLGIGECGLFRGLSCDDVPEYEQKLNWVCDNIKKGERQLLNELRLFPSIQFGLEQAFLSIASEDPFELFPSTFTNGKGHIPINGLIWMGSQDFMLDQIRIKLEEGFNCIKMKIGAIDFKSEISLLESIRNRYSKEEIELRVDANGAFTLGEAIGKLKVLSNFDIHSIEQPIRQGSPSKMKKLCETSPIPIALDEELIGILEVAQKEKLLQTIRPQYIILKPSLIGGFQGSSEWISIADKFGVGWWVTSALESNIGLNAIAQWTYTLKNAKPQGLGTGSLFTNNIECPLKVEKGYIYNDNAKTWKSNLIEGLCT